MSMLCRHAAISYYFTLLLIFLWPWLNCSLFTVLCFQVYSLWEDVLLQIVLVFLEKKSERTNGFRIVGEISGYQQLIQSYVKSTLKKVSLSEIAKMGLSNLSLMPFQHSLMCQIHLLDLTPMGNLFIRILL